MDKNTLAFKDTLPVAPLKLAAMNGCQEFAEKVQSHIIDFRRNDLANLQEKESNLSYRGYDRDSYMLDFSVPRFGTGEAKARINESVRGTDLFLLTDVMNHSITYKVCGQTNHMSPDDHFQDLKRVIGAACSKATRINVVMPFLYESRQHKRSARESLDCALALEELVSYGVENIITFDAHDPRVSNSIPLNGFDNFTLPYQFIKTLFSKEKNLIIDKDHMMIISPDEGAMNRSVYFANNMGVDMGMFYKRRDYSTIINGKNPIVAHEFLGSDVSGKTVIIVDDMISSGESILDTAKELKERKAEKVIICCTYGLFTDGLEKFDEYYSRGYIDYVITTNLNYRTPDLLTRDWYLEADISRFTAAIINNLNHDISIKSTLDTTEKIQKLVKQYKGL